MRYVRLAKGAVTVAVSTAACHSLMYAGFAGAGESAAATGPAPTAPTAAAPANSDSSAARRRRYGQTVVSMPDSPSRSKAT
ncbi:hypothetical protein [Streptomyces coeruleofuscus]|uniref:Lipoprotein n=1 Tax=Streptomyces coeruleofuscus TaxID=66879 RepID=A0ABP5VGD6_9ACTN